LDGSIEVANLLTITSLSNEEFFKTKSAVTIFAVEAGESLRSGSLEYMTLFVQGLMRITDSALIEIFFSEKLNIPKKRKGIRSIECKRLCM